jgi:hypothetical protein
MRTLFVLATLFAAYLYAEAQGYGRVVYIAPDGSLRASVIPLHIVDGDFSEHAVEIHDSAGKLLRRADYDSPDHEHGRDIMHAAWSPDSQFFVFSTTSSGGHSAWHFSTYVYVRSRNAVFYLDDLVGGPLVEPYFSFTSPAKFFSKRLNYRDGEKIAEQPIPVQVNLHDVTFAK